MSRLDELIEELCPDGVEYKSLDSVIHSLNTGLNPRQFFRLNTDDAENYYVTIRELHNNRIQFSESTDRINDVALKLCNNRSNLEAGDVLFSGTGTIGETALIEVTPSNWNIKEGVYSIKPIREVLNSKYLMYVLQSQEIKQAYMKKVAGGTVKSIPMKELRKIEIPVPPLLVQEEIVKILDKFTDYVTELQAELQARKLQYQHYLDAFYDTEKYEIIPLTSLGSLTRGKRFVHADATDSGVPCVHYGELYTYYGSHADAVKSHIREDLRPKMRYADPGDVIIVGAGENNIDIGVGLSWEGKEPVAVHDACYTLKHSQNSRYISYYLRSSYYHNQIKRWVSEGKICSISAQSLGKALIPIPPIDEQNRIAEILCGFEELCNDIVSGLPAEIEARQKQYEYYRDKLLSFKEIES